MLYVLVYVLSHNKHCMWIGFSQTSTCVHRYLGICERMLQSGIHMACYLHLDQSFVYRYLGIHERMLQSGIHMTHYLHLDQSDF